jgi:DNA polymerase V
VDRILFPSASAKQRPLPVANDLAKKSASGILELLDEKTIDAHLEKLPPSEIWGIGSRLNAQLREEKIFSSLQLKNASEIQIKKRFSVILLRTMLELRGIPSLSLEEVPEIRKSLTCSRTFGERLTELADIEEAVASYISSAAEKLRAEELFTSSLTVYITTSPFLKPPEYYANALTLTLDEPTSYTPLLITSAKEALRKIFRKGFLYKKAGIIFGEITSSRVVQTDLFSAAPVISEKRKRAMELVDQVNHTFGRGELRFAAEGVTKKWKGAKKSRSAGYTTRWSGLLEIQI